MGNAEVPCHMIVIQYFLSCQKYCGKDNLNAFLLGKIKLCYISYLIIIIYVCIYSLVLLILLQYVSDRLRCQWFTSMLPCMHLSSTDGNQKCLFA